MNIEEVKCEKKVVLLEDTKPYCYNDQGKKVPVNESKIFPNEVYTIVGTTDDGNVQIYCLTKNKAEIIDPSHIALVE